MLKDIIELEMIWKNAAGFDLAWFSPAFRWIVGLKNARSNRVALDESRQKLLRRKKWNTMLVGKEDGTALHGAGAGKKEEP